MIWEFERLEDLITYDCLPILLHCKLDDGRHFVLLAVDEVGSGYFRYLAIFTRQGEIEDYKDGGQTLYQLIQSAYELYLVDENEACELENPERVDFDDIPKEYLPDEDTYYEW